MARLRITMRKIRDILRLRLSEGLSIRKISASCKASVGTIHGLLAKAAELELSWPLPEDMDDIRLAALFYPGAETGADGCYQTPDWAEAHEELKLKSVTLLRLWEEYAEQYPNRCYSYTQFCHLYREWRKKQKITMRQVHVAGEKCFVDYCGHTIPILGAKGEEVGRAQIFVGVLGASQYTYAEATSSQGLSDWLGSHVRMLEYFGGSPKAVVPDNLRSGVSRACRYDPDTNPTYQQMADHYRMAVLPARPRRPQDKALAEVGVKLVSMWILARLRKHRFFSVEEVNRCVRELLEDLNMRPVKRTSRSRKDAFEQLDRPRLRLLPAQRWCFVEIKTVKVNFDYHVQYKKELYSAPHQYRGERLELHASAERVTLYFRQRQVASHPRRNRPGFSTVADHMPENHLEHYRWSPNGCRRIGRRIGPEGLKWVDRLLESRDHPEQAYRVCCGLMDLERRYSRERVNGACHIANGKGMLRLHHLRTILQNNRDRLERQPELPSLPQNHDNIRGPDHFK